MSETTPETNEKPRSAHLQAVRESQSEPKAAQSGPVRQGGGHMTGLLALLLAVAVFAFLAQLSGNRELQAANARLTADLETAQAELATARSQMTEARGALGDLRPILERIETLLAAPAAEGAAAAEGGEAAAPEPAGASAPGVLSAP